MCFTNIREKEGIQETARHLKRGYSIEKIQTHKIITQQDFYSQPAYYVWLECKGEIYLLLFSSWREVRGLELDHEGNLISKMYGNQCFQNKI